MIHINPYYLFSHVIFINIPKKFIFIEKRCWDAIHGVIFQNRLSTPSQRRRLRALFFKAYYDYMYHQVPVDVSKFNTDIFFIYGHFHFQSMNSELVVVDDDGDAVLRDDRPYYYESEENEIIKIEDDEIQDKIVKYREINVSQNIDDRLNVILNFWITKSKDFDTFISFYGYSRLRNNLKKFLFSKNCRIMDEDELFFIKFLIKDLAKIRNQIQDSEYFFICNKCLTVNQHKQDFRKNFVTHGFVVQKNPSCYSHHVKWYNNDGLLNLNYGLEDVDLKKEVFIKEVNPLRP
jgi:hypothetical protein